jgi:hypothetical protein
MPHFALALAATLVIVLPRGAAAQGTQIVIDEDFGDWEHVEPLYLAPPGQPDYFRALWAANDEAWLFLSLEVSEEIILQDSDIILWIDADGDAGTGAQVGDIGAELEWHFGQRIGTFHTDTGPVTIRHADIGILNAPTVSGTRFEIAIRRDAVPDGTRELFTSDEIRLRVHHSLGEGTLPPDETGLTYRFEDGEREREPIVLTRPAGAHLRVVSWNAERDAFFDVTRQPAYGRILRALEPDVIGFTEIYNGTAEQVRAVLEEIYPIDGEWHVEKPVGGGTAPGDDIVLASRFPIVDAEPIIWHQFRAPRTGAFVLNLRPAFDSDLRVYVSHPNCCQSTILRQEQLDAQMAHLREWKATATHGTPFMHVGDMNLVTLQIQQRTIIEGLIVNEAWLPSFAPDWDGTALADLKPVVTGLPMTFTWYQETSTFSPGRLDYIVYSDYALEALGGFSLFTEALTAEELTAAGLEAGDVLLASDHLPLVGDFRLVHVVSVEDEVPGSGPGSLRVYPNPSSDYFTITFDAEPVAMVSLEVVNVLGQRVLRMEDDGRSGRVTVDLRHLSPGVYFLRATSASNTATETLLLVR